MIDKIISQLEAEEFLRDFECHEITHVWYGAGTAIFLELGELIQDKRNNYKSELSLSIEWSWRIEDRNSILLGHLANIKISQKLQIFLKAGK